MRKRKSAAAASVRRSAKAALLRRLRASADEKRFPQPLAAYDLIGN